MHIIRFCDINESELLIDYLYNHWRNDHIFVKSKEILDWQYLNREEGRYNFVVAYNEVSCAFDAILGFIPTSHFDPLLDQYGEYWLAIWSVSDAVKKSLSGMNLLHFFRNKMKPSAIYAIGISDITKNIYKVLGYDVDRLDHYLIENESIKYKKIIKTENKDSGCLKYYSSFSNVRLIDLEDYIQDINDLLIECDIFPKKTSRYYINRYYKHSWIDYNYLGIFYNDCLTGVLVFRVLRVGDACCLRIIDWIGSLHQNNLYCAMQKVMQEFGAEYIDFLCKVPDENSLIGMGFRKKTPNEIVPEYFDPFVPENVDIYYCAKGTVEYRIVKGDSDQDRLNRLLTMDN